MFNKTLPVIIVLALILSACTFNVTFPGTQQVGPVTTDQVTVPLPDSASQPVDLTLHFGAGTLDLTPASETTALVSGTATYNIADFKPVITVNGSNIGVEQGNLPWVPLRWPSPLTEAPIRPTMNSAAWR